MVGANESAERLTPIRAIRAKCIDCMAGQIAEVRLCPCRNCPLYPYRMGHNPARKGMGGKFKGETATADNLPQ